MRYVLIALAALVILGVLAWAFAPQVVSRVFFAPTASSVPEGATSTGEFGEPGSAAADIAVAATDLSVPWGVAFLPDGAVLVTERSGTLARIESGAVVRTAVPGASERGEGGLLGIALHPDFDTNRLLYLYMTHEAAGGTENRVVRYRYGAGELTEDTVIIEGIPGAAYHDGGRIAFGPDGHLYITTGDAGDESSAQDRDALSGKILRLTADGEVPSGNPFGTAVYSYGHRNPQGLAWDEEGNLWSTEHGRSGVRSGYDELNRVEPGGNYGWPVIQGDEQREGMIAPVVHSGANETWAPASLAYRDGYFFWGGLRGQSLYSALRSGDSAVDVTAHFREEFGRIRTASFGPDGRLYITTSNTDGRGSPSAEDDRLISIDPGIVMD